MPSRLPVAMMHRVGDHAGHGQPFEYPIVLHLALPKPKEEVRQATADEGLKAWQFIDRAVQKAVKA